MEMSVEPRQALRDPRGQARDVDAWTSQKFTIERFSVAAGTIYETHYHDADQMAWMPAGSMSLQVRGEHWHLDRGHFAWIPAGSLHEMRILDDGELLDLYIDPSVRPTGERWRQPCTLQVDPLAASLLRHLLERPRTLARQQQTYALLAEVLNESDVRHDIVTMPSDIRARRIATALQTEPADPRELADWARELAVSEKTLSRAFVAQTGGTFRQWRQRLRLHAAAGMLARGRGVADVAADVGYGSTSSFVAAFAQRYGLTPGRYAREVGREAGEPSGPTFSPEPFHPVG